MAVNAQVFETIELRIDRVVATVRLNQPDDLNPLSLQMARELLAALEQLEQDPAVRAVLVPGSGRAFSAGADLKADRPQMPAGKPDVLTGLRAVYNPLMVKLRQLKKPVIAGVNGPAVGIGASLALNCDLMVAAGSAYFLLAFVNIGLTVDGGASVSIAVWSGYSRAAELTMLGGRLPAPTALQWGLVNQVVPDALEPTADKLVARLAAGPPGSYRAT
jgi:2-(1,2-epoxy-1,2-dihydrophenyl)acetyl-CoA isomerase